jgi:hypothetical protein
MGCGVLSGSPDCGPTHGSKHRGFRYRELDNGGVCPLRSSYLSWHLFEPPLDFWSLRQDDPNAGARVQSGMDSRQIPRHPTCNNYLEMDEPVYVVSLMHTHPNRSSMRVRAETCILLSGTTILSG